MDDPFKKPEMTDLAAPPKDGAPKEGDAAAMVAEAKASGKLKPLEDVMAEMGWDMDAGTALMLAQKDQAPGTQGKSPEDLAQMLRDDPAVYDDLEALQPGGVLDKLGKKDEPTEETDDLPPVVDDAGDDEAEEKEMGDYMEKSPFLKGGDPKKGVAAMKKGGSTSMKGMGMDAKSKFLRDMAE